MCLHGVLSSITFKYLYSCPIEIIKGLTDKGQVAGLCHFVTLFFRHFTWCNGVAKR